MIPILFNYDATDFSTHGIGDLMETTACESIVNAEGEYELELQYPADGPMIPNLLINNIIVAKVNDHGANQAFRIYGISKAINSLVTVKCQHLSYDLSCAPAIHFEETTCHGAMSELKNHAVGGIANPFTFYTDIPDSQKALNQDQKFKMEESTTVRAALLDGDDSIKGCWGGDLVFDNYSVSLLKVAGADRGVLVEYGIDLMDMEQEENISEMVTGVFPYWKGKEEGDEADADDKIVYGSIQYATGTFQRHRIIPLNVTEYYPNNTSAPTTAQIEQTAREWMTANDVGVPVINLTLSYAELGKDVRLHDAITVRFVKIGIDHKAKVISYKYDVLKERCIEVEVGSVKPSILFSLEDASRLKRGLIPPKRIANNSITSDHIENYGISGSNIGTGAVGSRSIDEGAVTEPKIGQWAVTTDKIGGLAVTTGKIANGGVTNEKIGDLAITTGKIAEGAVVEAKIGNSAITSVKIKDGEVITSKLHDSAVTTQKVADLAIDSAKIGNSAITSVKIKDGEVVEAKVANGAITTKKVADLAIDSAKIGNSAIISSKIKDGEVVNAKIYGGSDQNYRIDGSKFKELSIDGAKIGNSAITSLKIKDGEVVSGKFGPKSIKYADVADYQMDQLKLGDMSVTVSKVGRGGWAVIPGTNPPQYEWRDELIEAEYNEQGELVNGSPAIAPNALVEINIGDKQVGTIKLVQTAQDAIAAVWDIESLVAGTIWSDEYGGKYAYFDQVSAGNTNFNTLQCTNSFLFLGHPVSTDSKGNLHI